MKFTRLFVLLLAALFCATHVDRVTADTFGSGTNTFDIEFVTIGNPGNPADTSGNPNPAGSVAYRYRMGKFEISRSMVEKANAEGSLGITLAGPLFVGLAGPDKPATLVTWFETARFVNWLNTSSGGTPAYKFDGDGNFQNWDPGDAGYNPANLYRNSLARYFLPSADEWYKAAYYDPSLGVYWNYPTGINTAPTPIYSGTAAGTAVYSGQQASGDYPTGPADVMLAGGLSPYGTMGQGGNVWEWEETDADGLNGIGSLYRVDRGGSWLSSAQILSAPVRFIENATDEFYSTGFRVASIVVPEPSTFLLGALASVGLLLRRQR